MISGLCGSGKTTLAGRIAEEDSTRIVKVNSIMRRIANAEGFSNKASYLWHYGCNDGLERLRTGTLEQLLRRTEN